MVRIHGLIAVRQPNPLPQAGLLVYDDVLGPAYGQLVDSKRGTQQPANSTGEEYVPFTLYRLAPDSGQMRIIFETRGEGEFIVQRMAADYMLLDRSIVPLMPLEWEQPRGPISPQDSSMENSITIGGKPQNGAASIRNR